MCADRTSACERLMREFKKTNRTYVALLALEVLRYGELADLLTPEDWTVLEKKNIPWKTEPDNTQTGYLSRAFQMLRSSLP